MNFISVFLVTQCWLGFTIVFDLVFYSVSLFKYSLLIPIAWNGVSLIPTKDMLEVLMVSILSVHRDFRIQFLKVHHRCKIHSAPSPALM